MNDATEDLLAILRRQLQDRTHRRDASLKDRDMEAHNFNKDYCKALEAAIKALRDC